MAQSLEEMMFYTTVYLASVILANLSAAHFGPAATPVNAFLLVGLAITTRDALHDAWGNSVRWRMPGIILTGGALSYVLGDKQIALASAAAFVVSETADYLVYRRLLDLQWMVRSNGSNAVSAVVDSVVFPTLAFGVLMPKIIALQIAAKFVGGWLWSLAIANKRRAAAAAVLALVLAQPAPAQIVSLGAGAVFTEVGEEPTLELFAATPPLGRLRLTSVIAVNDEPDMTYIAKGSVETWSWLSLETGASMLKFRDYDPEWFVGAFLRKRVRRFQLGVALSFEPENDWNATAVVKVDFWSWFRR